MSGVFGALMMITILETCRLLLLREKKKADRLIKESADLNFHAIEQGQIGMLSKVNYEALTITTEGSNADIAKLL